MSLQIQSRVKALGWCYAVHAALWCTYANCNIKGSQFLKGESFLLPLYSISLIFAIVHWESVKEIQSSYRGWSDTTATQRRAQPIVCCWPDLTLSHLLRCRGLLLSVGCVLLSSSSLNSQSPPIGNIAYYTYMTRQSGALADMISGTLHIVICVVSPP